MKRYLYLSIILFITTSKSFAQDEGNITKIARIEKDKSVFVDFGPSLTLGKNIGDYSTGFNVGLGFMKRINRLLSIGPSISYLSFKYDPKKTTTNSAYVGYVNDPDTPYYEGYVINLTGGDLSLVSLGANIKLNLIPIKERTIISPYIFAKPFATMVQRSDVNGVSDYYVDYDDDNGWQLQQEGITWGPDDYKELKGDSKFTGGIFVGPGIEIMPSKRFSGFLQASLGYTLPIKYVSTKAYDSTTDAYFNEKFPMIRKGFPSINVQAGFSFNF